MKRNLSKISCKLFGWSYAKEEHVAISTIGNGAYQKSGNNAVITKYMYIYQMELTKKAGTLQVLLKVYIYIKWSYTTMIGGRNTVQLLLKVYIYIKWSSTTLNGGRNLAISTKYIYAY